MKPWRKIAVLGIVGSFVVAGCTVTTSDGNFDSGVFDETGGTGNQGGSNSTGGTGGNGTTVVQCTGNYQAPAPPASPACGDQGNAGCDACVQTYLCQNAFKVCDLTAGCTKLISDMGQCMADAADRNGGVLPTGQDGICQGQVGMTGTGAGAAEARALWTEIQGSIYCSLPCCAEV